MLVLPRRGRPRSPLPTEKDCLCRGGPTKVGPYGRAVAGLLLRPDIESPRWARFASPNPLQTRIAPTGGFLRFVNRRFRWVRTSCFHMSARSCGFEGPGPELSLSCGEKCDRASFRAFETRMIVLFLARGLFLGSKDSHDRTFLCMEGEKASLGARSQVCISEVGASSRSARRPILG